jgi:hypothetical protein
MTGRAGHRMIKMSDLSFSPVRKVEQARAFATLVHAFASDPVERWLFPGSQQYLSIRTGTCRGLAWTPLFRAGVSAAS